jgi:hypothetical protein
MNGELRALRDRIASAIADEAKRRTIPPAWPAGPGGSGATMQEVADAVMAVVQPELDRLTERIPYREGETEEDYLYRQVARWRSEAWQARGKLKAAGSERDQLKVAAQAETRAANRWMAEANQAEAERDQLKAQLDRFRTYLDRDFRTWCSPHGIAATYATRLIEILDQPEGA